MTKLIAYYSRTGHNAEVAKELRKILKCDIEEIVSKTSYKGFLGFLRGGYRGARKKLVEIEEPEKDASKYDLLIMLYPIWGNAMAPPARSYLEKAKPKKIAMVSVSGGGGSEKDIRDLAQTSGLEPVATLQLSDEQFKNREYMERLEKFAKGL